MVDRLCQDWAAGYSASEIGVRMGLNKNQVIGKVHRLQLAPRGQPAALQNVKDKPRVLSSAHLSSSMPSNSGAGASKPRPQLFPGRGCQFPRWKHGERPAYGEARYCEAAPRRNEEGRQDSPYCVEHHARCFDKKRAA